MADCTRAMLESAVRYLNMGGRAAVSLELIISRQQAECTRRTTEDKAQAHAAPPRGAPPRGLLLSGDRRWWQRQATHTASIADALVGWIPVGSGCKMAGWPP